MPELEHGTGAWDWRVAALRGTPCLACCVPVQTPDAYLKHCCCASADDNPACYPQYAYYSSCSPCRAPGACKIADALLSWTGTKIMICHASAEQAHLPNCFGCILCLRLSCTVLGGRYAGGCLRERRSRLIACSRDGRQGSPGLRLRRSSDCLRRWRSVHCLQGSCWRSVQLQASHVLAMAAQCLHQTAQCIPAPAKILFLSRYDWSATMTNSLEQTGRGLVDTIRHDQQHTIHLLSECAA